MAQDLGQVLAGVEHALSLTELAHHLTGRVALPLHCGHPPLVGLDSHSRRTAIRRPVWRYQNDRSPARSCLVDQGIGTCPNGGYARAASASGMGKGDHVACDPRRPLNAGG